jgi:hypothetical protein
MKFQTAASHGLRNPTGRLCGDGQSYGAGAGSLGLQYLTSTRNSWVTYNLGPLMTDAVTAGVWFYSNIPNSDLSNLDVFTIFGKNGADFANAKYLGGGTVQNPQRIFQLEVGSGGGNANINVQANTWYWLSLRYSKSGSHSLSVYDTAGALVGSITEVAAGTTKPDYVVIGQSNSDTPTSGYVVNFDSMVIDLTGSALTAQSSQTVQTLASVSPASTSSTSTAIAAAPVISSAGVPAQPIRAAGATALSRTVDDILGEPAPLYVEGVGMPGYGTRNMVYVATEQGSIYAFDADGLTTEPLWRVSLVDPAAGVTTVPAEDAERCCGSVSEVGISGTPAIDLATGTLYVVGITKETRGGTVQYVLRLHALDIATGEEKYGGPVVLAATDSLRRRPR